ncbi:uncharacterized protein LOC126880831 [Diabrotica virgifera virgifera]|uniref:Uncharacterized protein n=1 Tax=Diabrotica virgifera virgifera TaxID=50390 RepID=A0ABM5JSD2_DIAVI|nr:uncharacterized protein LOC126880831 [Diabrotica virgifera virgifera]
MTRLMTEIAGFPLTCLKCSSSDVNGSCRSGSKPRRGNRPRQVCRGDKAKCFAVASVNDYGQSHFQRGCTRSNNICEEREDVDIAFCLTCKSLHCNYDYMLLNATLEEILNIVNNDQIREENFTPASLTTTSTVSVTTPPHVYKTTKSPLADTKTSRLNPVNVKSESKDELQENLPEDGFFEFDKRIPTQLSNKISDVTFFDDAFTLSAKKSIMDKQLVDIDVRSS